MAIVILGKSKCVVCGETIADSSYVTFCAFDTIDRELEQFSNSGVHYRCIGAHPRRADLEGIFRNVFGPDGIHRGKHVVSTPTRSVRVKLGAREVTLCHHPTFLILRMPLGSASRWIASSFWKELREREEAAFEDRGIRVAVKTGTENGEIILGLCPRAYIPSTCQAFLVEELWREVSREEALAFANDCRSALGMALAQ